jgi:hypothetical protein
LKKYFLIIVCLIFQLNICLGNDSISNKKTIYLKFNPVGLFHPIHYVSASAEFRFTNRLAYETELGIINSITGIPYIRVQRSKTNQIFPQRIGIRTVNTFKIYYTRKKNKNKNKTYRSYFAPEIQYSFHLLKDDSYLYSNIRSQNGNSYSRLFPTKSTFSQIAFYVKWGWQYEIGRRKKAIIDTYFGFGYYGIKQYAKVNQSIPSEFNQLYLDSRFHKFERMLSNDDNSYSNYFMINFGVKFGKKMK